MAIASAYTDTVTMSGGTGIVWNGWVQDHVTATANGGRNE